MKAGNLRQNPWVRWVPAILWMAVIFIASSTPSSQVPSFGGWDFWVKKSSHLLSYALLAFLYRLALGPSASGAGWKAGLLAVLFAISDELHQMFTPGRNPWIVDVLIDVAGAGIALIFVQVLQWKAASLAP